MFENIKGLFKKSKEASPTKIDRNVIDGETINNNYDIVQAQTQRKTISRIKYYLDIDEMMSSPFIRGIIQVQIARAVGVTHDDNKPFSTTLKRDTNIKDENIKEQLRTEFEHVDKILAKNYISIMTKALGYGDAYPLFATEDKKGLTAVIDNVSLSPQSVSPIVDTRRNLVAIGLNNDTKISIQDPNIYRINMLPDGYETIPTENIPYAKKQYLFNEDETHFEDNIYGGILHGAIESYRNFIWAVDALANKRINDGTLTRFITVSMQGLSPENKELLTNSLKEQLKNQRTLLANRIREKDTTPAINNIVIATTNENSTGALEVQESESSSASLSTIDDITIHIKRFMDDIGFDFSLTALGDRTQSGGEREGVAQGSLLMDVISNNIRNATRSYVERAMQVHFESKFGLAMTDMDNIKISFVSVINKAKMTSQMNLTEALSNASQVATLLDQYKAMTLKDSPETRTMLYGILEPIIANDTIDREKTIEVMIDTILTPPPAEDGM